MIRLGYLLEAWLQRQPAPRGQVLGGEAGIRLRSSPDTTVGADVAYVSAELLARQTDASTLIEGVPTLVAEILSPNDTVEEINEKIDEYLAAGVSLVWIVNPHHKTITVHRPGEQPELFNLKQTLVAGPELPGFQFAVAEAFL
jgi:Uma2 family endonuclease